MRIHSLEHVWFENLANIEVWAKAKSHSITKTLVFQEPKFPSVDELDMLIIMGGPMSVHDQEQYPWLAAEKTFIEEAIARGKSVLGICLGAQLIASVFGARVYKNRHKEIGWHPIFLSDEAHESEIFRFLPGKFAAFHWHGETFDLPDKCRRVAGSEACANQAFESDAGRVIALQFHLESSRESIRLLIENCSSDLVPGKYVQTAEQMLSQQDAPPRIETLMTHLLDQTEKRAKKS